MSYYDDDFDTFRNLQSVLANDVALDGEPVICHLCGRRCDTLDDQEKHKPEQPDVYLDGDAGWVCEACVSELTPQLIQEAEAYAREHCRITRPPHKFDPEFECRCTPKEYDDGDRMSYTENSVWTTNRHECTNYDQLLEELNLERDSIAGQVYYRAIRRRIREIIDDAELDDPGTSAD